MTNLPKKCPLCWRTDPWIRDMDSKEKVFVCSGCNTKFNEYLPITGAIKSDTEKPDMSLLPPEVLIEVAKVFSFGAAKYSADNWRLGFKYRRLIAAGMRHRNAFNAGEDNDLESGINHLAHSIACDMILLAQVILELGIDDRPKQGESK